VIFDGRLSDVIDKADRQLAPTQTPTDLRRLVQRTLFAPPRDLEPGELYYSIQRGVATAERHRIVIEPHAWITTNTYFGRFPASYWQRWTRVDEVFVQAEVQGAGRVFLVASDSAGSPRTVASTRVSSTAGERIELRAAVNRFADGGALWLEAETGPDQLTLSDVRWQVTTHGTTRAAVVVICTFNRADDCLVTLDTLAADTECLAALDAVYVIDQGSDPVASRDGFTTTSCTLGPKLQYMRQPNLGGAGGFTRGLYEATSARPDDPSQWPYTVLMDDDIVLEPDTVLRMTGFAAHTDTPTIIGGQMLQLLHPHRLHVGAEEVDLRSLCAGRPVAESIHDADMTTIRQDIRVDAGYNAWWSCLIPPEVLADVGYPLPLFFQWDDIEYGIRARAGGYPTVTLPGAGVWHADFSWKDWDDWPRYFSLRNSMIVSALHSDFNVTRTARILLGELFRYLGSMRYGLAATLIMAVEDFMRGPDVLADGGAESAAAIRKMRAEHPETIRHPACGAPALPARPLPIVPAQPAPSKPRVVLGKRIIWHLAGKSQGDASISARDNHWWHVALFNTAVVTDPSQEGVKVRRRDRAMMSTLAFHGVRTIHRLIRDGRRTQQQYRAAMPELTSRANWARLFDTD
jgi:galactofuranosylgalactofuranosylrhamnosyl-N-acetylglucosaminyl-diphospho-decaprenol beta-1,5/1,6-galactofuranosyltransferase